MKTITTILVVMYCTLTPDDQLCYHVKNITNSCIEEPVYGTYFSDMIYDIGDTIYFRQSIDNDCCVNSKENLDNYLLKTKQSIINSN